MNPEIVKAKFKSIVNGLTAEEIIIAAQKDADQTTCSRNETLPPIHLLKGVFPAEQQFQKYAYNDQNKNSVGEYGTLSQLCGNDKPLGDKDGNILDKGQIELISPAVGSGEDMGYKYAIYLPDGVTAAITVSGIAGCEDREKYFVCYAWPSKPFKTGSKLFAITQDGKLYCRNLEVGETQPAWNGLFKVKTGSAKEIFTSASWFEYVKSGE